MYYRWLVNIHNTSNIFPMGTPGNLKKLTWVYSRHFCDKTLDGKGFKSG